MPVQTIPFSEYMQGVEAEARSQGLESELEEARLYFRLAAEMVAARRRLKLTQKTVALASGIPQSEISRLERGKANPTLRTVMAVAHALGFTLEFVPARAPARRVGRKRQ